MARYRNLSGNSPITHYEISDDSIAIWFKNDKKNPYVYPVYKIDNYHLQVFTQRAIAGEGLSTYITKYVKDKFIH